MLDPKLFRSELDATLQQLARRGFTLDAQRLTALENERKEIQVRHLVSGGSEHLRQRHQGRRSHSIATVDPVDAWIQPGEDRDQAWRRPGGSAVGVLENRPRPCPAVDVGSCFSAIAESAEPVGTAGVDREQDHVGFGNRPALHEDE